MLAFVRRYESEQILCVANLSRFLQVLELDLSKWEGMVPVELFGSTELPVVGKTPYFLTLGPHSFYWFSLQPRTASTVPADWGLTAAVLPEVKVEGGWDSVLFGVAKEQPEGTAWQPSSTGHEETDEELREAIAALEGGRRPGRSKPTHK